MYSHSSARSGSFESRSSSATSAFSRPLFASATRQKYAAVALPALVDLVHDGGGVDEREHFGRFGLLVEQREQRPRDLALTGTAEGERGSPSLLRLTTLGDAHETLAHGADRDSGRQLDHVQVLWG